MKAKLFNGSHLENNFNIHASGKVRIDRLDQQGISMPLNANTPTNLDSLKVFYNLLVLYNKLKSQFVIVENQKDEEINRSGLSGFRRSPISDNTSIYR